MRIEVTGVTGVEELLTDVRSYLRIDYTDEDVLLVGAIIPAAVRRVEDLTGVALLAQTVTEWRDAVMGEQYVMLQRAPISSITSVAVYDDDDTETVIDATDYDLVGGDVLHIHRLSVTPREEAALKIIYTAGYGASAIPAPLLQAVLYMAAHLYEHRLHVADRRMVIIPDTVHALLADYRRRVIESYA